jgi:polyisoprenoid-binding protein YceI
VLFKVKHANTSYAFGRFDNVSGYVHPLPDNMERSMINITVDAASIDTNEKKRDAHLKSNAFFDVEQFPDATFVSRRSRSRVIRSTPRRATSRSTASEAPDDRARGDGRDRPREDGRPRRVLRQFTVKRSDFGMQFMPDMLGDEVQVTVSIEGRQTDAK